MGNIDVKLYAKIVELQAEAMPINKFWSYSNIIVYHVQKSSSVRNSRWL
jgi:hypothetical protein